MTAAEDSLDSGVDEAPGSRTRQPGGAQATLGEDNLAAGNLLIKLAHAEPTRVKPHRADLRVVISLAWRVDRAKRAVLRCPSLDVIFVPDGPAASRASGGGKSLRCMYRLADLLVTPNSSATSASPARRGRDIALTTTA